GKSSLTYQKLLDKAADEVKDPAEQLNIAIHKLEQAFLQPKLFEALNQLAQNAPAAAEALAKVIGFIAKHPLAGGALALGARAGTSFAGTALTELLFGGGGKGGGGKGADVAAAGAKAGASMCKSLVGSI